MTTKKDEVITNLLQNATQGNTAALEELLSNVQDLIFNVSLRMLGTFPDAEEATQEILLKIATHLPAFRAGKCLFYLGFPYFCQPFIIVQEAYVCTCASQL